MGGTSKTIRVVSIASAGHSGSTLLGLILSGSAKLLVAGEFYALTRDGTLTSQGVPVAEDPVWQNAYEELHGTVVDVRQSKVSRLLQLGRYREHRSGRSLDTLAWGDRYYRAIKKSCEAAGADTFVISTTLITDKLELLAADPRFEVSVIHLIRDGRGVAHSYAKKHGAPGKQVLRWHLVNMKISWLTQRFRLPNLVLSYEELTRTPEAALQRVCDFIGIEYTSQLLRFREHPHRLVGGNRMRFNTTAEITEDRKWLTESARATRLWYRVCAPLRLLAFSNFRSDSRTHSR